MRAAAIAILVTVVACGGGGDGSNGDSNTVDAAKVFMDAPPPMIDAPPPVTGLGQACTPGMTPQANCPAGFECLNLTGGAGAWCSKLCTSGAGDTCATGYTGPGLAVCIFDIMAEGMATRRFCGIVCMENTGTVCPATKCNGTCPTPMMCTANLTNSMGQTSGKACF